MKNFAIIQSDNTILVKTPVPYIVDIYKDKDKEELQDIAFRLSESTKFLYDCLRVLKISKAEAIEKRYTLNTRTGNELTSIALHRSPFISGEMFKAIRNYNW